MTLTPDPTPAASGRSHPMNKAEVLAALRNFSLEDILDVIEVASQLLRRALTLKPSPATLAEAAAQMQPFYEANSELTQWTDEDPEEVQEYADYA